MKAFSKTIVLGVLFFCSVMSQADSVRSLENIFYDVSTPVRTKLQVAGELFRKNRVDVKMVDAVISILKEDSHTEIKFLSADALVEITDNTFKEKISDAFLDVLTSAYYGSLDQKLYPKMVRSLGRLGVMNKKVIHAFTMGLSYYTNDEIRKTIRDTIESFGSYAFEDLKYYLNHENDPKLRTEILLILYALGPKSDYFTADLLKFFDPDTTLGKNTSQYSKVLAVLILEKIGIRKDPKIIPALSDLKAKDEDPVIQIITDRVLTPPPPQKSIFYEDIAAKKADE